MSYNYFVLAKILHVIAVVIWIGGVAFVTTVLIPALRKTQSPEERLKIFELLEGKFSLQAKFTTLLTGATGFYMLHAMNAWSSSMQWWVYPMIFVWALFTVVLFVLEPLFLHKQFHKRATTDSEKTFFVLQIMHIVLLTISLLVIFCVVAGVRGLLF
uniref:Uncharacterized membrane protein n=1 Tax=Candidatus Kentrum sp. LFY TaxID=2126342 RepID=A0A450UEJ5_9GAMM|nr:MAG: Uncharacterized membrane protein [Candidatus Kentron sp. LFY]